MKKTTLSIALVTALGLSASIASADQLYTITWDNSVGGETAFGDVITAAGTARIINGGSGAPFSTAFTTTTTGAGSEFRMISPFASIGGGGEKDTIFGGETWGFGSNGDTATPDPMTSVGSTGTNSGAANSPVAPTAGSNPALQQGADFFGGLFTFLAPTTTSLAGGAYGPGELSFNSTDNFTIFFSVLEAQWGNTYFPLGSDDTNGTNGLGITFDCTGALSGNIHCEAEELIDPSEDPGSAGFAFWTAQWDMKGTLTPVHSAVPVPAAVWLFGSGLLGLVGVARRKKA